ncbi:MAG TPA: hypothetical protein DCP63_00850, partial [Bacteroidetes bacterium]|nr:hypothetical protein [Bacteroidota bacterium]
GLSCSTTLKLTDAEKARLDPALQGLFEAGDTDSSRFDVSNRSDGSKEYGVIIRTANADEIRIAGVVVESVMGDVVTARVTLIELKKILALPSVRSIQNSAKNYPH